MKKENKIKEVQPKITEESVKKLSDEELNKIAGGTCQPNCRKKNGGCYC